MKGPLVHMNGTPANHLMRVYEKAYEAISAAAQAIAETSPNMRDYYPLPDGEKQLREEEKLLMRYQQQLAEMAEHFADLNEHVFLQHDSVSRRQRTETAIWFPAAEDERLRRR